MLDQKSEAPEIEVTADMIEAGATVLDYFVGETSRENLAKQVFEAMVGAAAPPQKRSEAKGGR